jgi:hypothetical protein
MRVYTKDMVCEAPRRLGTSKKRRQCLPARQAEVEHVESRSVSPGMDTITHRTSWGNGHHNPSMRWEL